MRIQEVEQTVGITKKSIRFYEQEGLLHPGRETGNGYRNYSEAEVLTLRRIKLMRWLAVPLEEIRQVQQGQQTLADCLYRHSQALSEEQHRLSRMESLCREMAGIAVDYAHWDVAAFEERIRQLEEGGVRFPAIRDRRRKKAAPVGIAAGFITLFLALCALLLWARAAFALPWPFVILSILVFSGLTVGILLALRQRMQEIDKGEEDEAVHY